MCFAETISSCAEYIFFVLKGIFRLQMLLCRFGIKFARPICNHQIFDSRPLFAVSFFTRTSFKGREDSVHLERRTRPKSRIPKKEATWWESSRKQLGEEWEKALGGALLIGFSLLFMTQV